MLERPQNAISGNPSRGKSAACWALFKNKAELIFTSGGATEGVGRDGDQDPFYQALFSVSSTVL